MERLCGHIHNVVYEDPETGFAVVQVIPESGTAPEAVVGPLQGLRKDTLGIDIALRPPIPRERYLGASGFNETA